MRDDCTASHEASKTDDALWASFEQIGSMPTYNDEPGSPQTILLANCPRCHSTICREVKP